MDLKKWLRLFLDLNRKITLIHQKTRDKRQSSPPVMPPDKRHEIPQIGPANVDYQLKTAAGAHLQARLPMNFSSHDDHTKRKASLHRTAMNGRKWHPDLAAKLFVCKSIDRNATKNRGHQRRSTRGGSRSNRTDLAAAGFSDR
jgi:hypothetical protein